jgi:hypothetical protein
MINMKYKENNINNMHAIILVEIKPKNGSNI